MAALLLVAGACDESEKAEPEAVPEGPSPTQAAPKASEGTASGQQPLAGEYAHMAEMYQQMAGMYGHVRGAMRGGAQWMEQMHRQMTHLREHGPGMMRGGGTAGRGMMGRGMMRGGGMMHGGGMMGRIMSGMDRWHEQMAQMNEQWATEAAKAGNQELADRHRETALLHRKVAKEIEDSVGTERPEEPSGEGGPDGAALFAETCAGCHGAEGQGVPGAFPPLAENPVVGGPAKKVIQIVHDGLTGPLEVKGTQYNGVMPAFGGRLSNAEIAAILSHIRTSLGNDASPVGEARVTRETK